MTIAVIRITGQIGLNSNVKETLYRMRLRKKYTCVLLENTPENIGKIKSVKNLVAYGDVSEETIKKLNEKRKTKIENFFRLHPPRKGIDSKKHFGETPKAVLGNNKEKINDLIERML
jgi:ribosomal protein L30/L7E